MRVLLVYCNPVPESFGASLRQAAVEALVERGHEVEVRDLYALGFDPVMSADERRGYHVPDVNEAPVADELAALRRCEALVFVHPTWWYGPPAMLKGWLDRVWIPHATFEMPKPGLPVTRRLTNIRRIAVITTLGAPWWWWTFVMRSPGRRMILTGLSVLCHPRCRTTWLAHHQMDSSTPATRAAFLARIRRVLATF